MCQQDLRMEGVSCSMTMRGQLFTYKYLSKTIIRPNPCPYKVFKNV